MVRRQAGILAVVLVFAAGLVAVVRLPAGAATLPNGFTDSLVGSVAAPTALEFTPDGRMLTTTQPGRLFVARDGVLGTTPALDLSTAICSQSERGMLGVAVDTARRGGR